MKNITFIILTLYGIALLTSCYGENNYNPSEVNTESEIMNVHISFDFYPYSGIEELSSSSTDIIRATVIGKRVDKIDIALPSALIPPELFASGLIPPEYKNAPHEYNPRYEVFTIYSLNVVDVFKGNINANEIIEFAIIGGQFEDMYIINEYNTRLILGDDLIFFMTAPRVEGRPFFKASMTQSIYRFVEPDPNILVRGLNIEFESVNERGGLILTLSDLERIIDAKTQVGDYNILYPEITNESYDEYSSKKLDYYEEDSTTIEDADIESLPKDSNN